MSNKWDLIEDKYKKKAQKYIDAQLAKFTGLARSIPITFISAKTGYRLQNIMDEVFRVYEKWNTRVSTRLSNKWLFHFERTQRMPHKDGNHLKMRLLMQIKVRPPTFFLYVNNRKIVDTKFEKFIKSQLAKELSLIHI